MQMENPTAGKRALSSGSAARSPRGSPTSPPIRSPSSARRHLRGVVCARAQHQRPDGGAVDPRDLADPDGPQPAESSAKPRPTGAIRDARQIGRAGDRVEVGPQRDGGHRGGTRRGGDRRSSSRMPRKRSRPPTQDSAGPKSGKPQVRGEGRRQVGSSTKTSCRAQAPPESSRRRARSTLVAATGPLAKGAGVARPLRSRTRTQESHDPDRPGQSQHPVPP